MSYAIGEPRSLVEQLAKVSEERDRYREALERIAETDDAWDAWELRVIARESLKR